MNKRRVMTMLVAFALSVSALSTTAVFAEDETITNGDNATVTETTTVASDPEVTLTTDTWTGDNDIVLDVKTNGAEVGLWEVYVYENGFSYPARGIEEKVELDAEGNGKITISKDQLKAAKTVAVEDEENTVAIDWTKINKIELNFGFELNGDYKYKTVYVPVSYKVATPATPATPSTPAKPSQSTTTTTTTTNNKGTTTSATKKNYPQTGDTMNVAVYASMLVMSALFITVILRKKNINE